MVHTTISLRNGCVDQLIRSLVKKLAVHRLLYLTVLMESWVERKNMVQAHKITTQIYSGYEAQGSNSSS